MPLSFFAEAVVSAMYLRALRGDKIGLVQIREVAGYPGSAGLVARLAGMCAFWLAVVVMVLAALLIAPILVMGIGIHLGHEARHGNQWFPILIMVTSVAVLSRYYFVMPMLAVRRSGGGDVFRAAVVKIKGYWGLLAVVGLVEYFASHFASQLAKRAGDWRGGRQTAVVAEILFSAVIATYVVAFITDLLVGQDADV